MASKAVRIINSGYHSRYARKPSKGIGVYADQMPGVGPRGLHVKGITCHCGGCEGSRNNQ